MKIRTLLKITRRDRWLIIVTTLVSVPVVMYWRPIQQRALIHFVLRSDTVAQMTVDELAASVKDPAAFLQGLWVTQKIPHRLAVANYLSVHCGNDPALLTRMEPLLEEAASDGDLEVRAVTLGFMGLQHRANALTLAKEQLNDPDPEARILALQYLREAGDRSLVPWAARSLEDTSPRVASTAATALRHWTGLDFGVRVFQTLPGTSEGGSERANQADGGTAVRGIQHWKVWWELHQTDYPRLPDAPRRAVSTWRLATPDFSVQDLEGKPVRLSDFRGKVVLLNFWDTATPACLLELNNLTELQRRNPDRLVVLGISLDTTVDERSCCEDEVENHTKHGKPEVQELRGILRDITRQKGVNYPILIDSSGSVGCRFDANNLPANILIDADGYVRRRFIGGRPPAVLDAMINEIIKGLENSKK